jgi:hypothetical protein
LRAMAHAQQLANANTQQQSASHPANTQQQSASHPATTSSNANAANQTPCSPMRATPAPMLRTRSSVFREMKKNLSSATSSNPNLSVSNSNSNNASQANWSGPVVTFADQMPSGMEASQACSNEGEASTGEAALRKSYDQ